MPNLDITIMANESGSPAFISQTTFGIHENPDGSTTSITSEGLVENGAWSNGGYSTQEDFPVSIPYHDDADASPQFLGTNNGIVSVNYYAPGEFKIDGTIIISYVITFTIYNLDHQGGSINYISYIDQSQVDENRQTLLQLEISEEGKPKVVAK